jgi:8-oxo-dGTP pyrophosphatase MutT (NUDIX family)
MNSKGLPEVFLGVVQNMHGEVLIVHRVKEENGTGRSILSWVFPGGDRDSEGQTMEEVVVGRLLAETGYKVVPGKVISEREHPEFPVYIYYVACSLEKEIPEIVPSDPDVENAKWVKPSEIPNYFTSDFDPKVKEALAKISN